jgi:hypothetical protein
MKKITIRFILTNGKTKQEEVTAINVQRARESLKYKYTNRISEFVRVVKIESIKE